MIVVLARAAENAYWIGRYLERASDVVRMLNSADTVSTDVGVFSPDAPNRIWSEIESVLAAPTSPSTACSASGQCRRFLLDLHEPMSVASSIRNARENARAFRDTLSLEAFTLLNATWRRTQALVASLSPTDGHENDLTPIAIRGALDEMQQAIFAVCGAIDRTGSRNDAWRFLHMGTLLERALRTSETLRVVLPGIVSEEASTPARYARMRALLRSLAALEAYHREYGARLDPELLLAFLMFNPDPPHSLLPCIEAIDRDLTLLERRGRVEDPSRRAGLLLARLRFEGGDANLDAIDTLPSQLSEELSGLHQSITEQFFTV